MNGRELIENIRKAIEADKGRRIWEDAVRAIFLVSELIFTRSSHFIIELIQNAEDAGMGLPNNGEMSIKVSRKRVLITHNARPFDEEDVNAICGLRTTKKPELGSIGYLGIGFKSVFKITDSPYIFSGKYQFKFDKNVWDDPNKVPWQIIPLWVNDPPEDIDLNKTTFYLPFRDEKAYEETKRELQNIGLHLYLFLKWLKKIEIINEETGESTILENIEEKNGIVTLARDGKKERYLIFRRICEVPSYVKDDEVTKSAKRSNVKQREIIVAFRVDEEGNLVPLTAAEAYGGVYSFLPLGEERSGAKFLIQADFIVVPGRESINYEAVWNHWLIEQVTELVKEAIEKFKQNAVWQKQYLSLFEFTEYRGQPSFDKLFYPKLHKPLLEYLTSGKSIPTYDGKFTESKNAVVVSEDMLDLISEKDLRKLFPEKENPKIVLPKTELGPFRNKIDFVDILKIAKNRDFLKEKTKEPNAVEWFEKLYSRIYEWCKGYSSGPIYLWNMGYLPVWILTENLEIKGYDEVYFKEIPSEVIELSKKYPEVNKILGSLPFLHPILEHKLPEFFETYLRVKRMSYSKICEEIFLPKIRTTNQPPSKEELIAYTCLIQKSGVPIHGDIWVLTKSGDIKQSSEVFFSAEYSPAQNWEKNKKYIPGVEFLSTDYIQGLQNMEEIKAWRRFFANVGVKEQGSKAHVDEFGINFAKEKLKSELIERRLGYYFIDFDDVQKQNLGYDLIGKTATDERKYLEIKSRVQAEDIELYPHETEQAERYGDDYLLCIIDGIPNTPELYIIPNPVKHGKKEKVTIPKSIWKGFKIEI